MPISEVDRSISTYTAVAWVDEVISTVSIEDLSNIVKMLFGGGGLLALFKLLRGRQPESVEIDEQGGWSS